MIPPLADAAARRPVTPADAPHRVPIPAGRPVVLDFDASVPFLGPEEIRLPLADWQEDIRFGCPFERYAALEGHLDGLMPDSHGPVFTGSGDYHHLTLCLLKRLFRRAGPPFPGGGGAASPFLKDFCQGSTRTSGRRGPPPVAASAQGR